MSTTSSPRSYEETTGSAWAFGVVTFAGVMLVTVATFQILEGIAAHRQGRGLRRRGRVRLQVRRHDVGLDPHRPRRHRPRHRSSACSPARPGRGSSASRWRSSGPWRTSRSCPYYPLWTLLVIALLRPRDVGADHAAAARRELTRDGPRTVRRVSPAAHPLRVRRVACAAPLRSLMGTAMGVLVSGSGFGGPLAVRPDGRAPPLVVSRAEGGGMTSTRGAQDTTSRSRARTGRRPAADGDLHGPSQRGTPTAAGLRAASAALAAPRPGDAERPDPAGGPGRRREDARRQRLAAPHRPVRGRRLGARRPHLEPGAAAVLQIDGRAPPSDRGRPRRCPG